MKEVLLLIAIFIVCFLANLLALSAMIGYIFRKWSGNLKKSGLMPDTKKGKE